MARPSLRFPLNCGTGKTSANAVPKKKIERVPFIIALSLLAVIAVFSVTTCIVFFSRTMPADEIYRSVNPSVFFISVSGQSVKKGGTGFFIDDKGTAVTNYHVLSGGSDAEVTLYDGKRYKIDKILGVDSYNDIAVFHVDVPKSKKVKTANSSKIKTGDKVYTIGYPESFVLGVDSSTFTDGIISKASYNINGVNYIQTNADFTHGNSGGVLINDKGAVIGITTGKINIAGVSYMNCALPINGVGDVKREYSCSLGEFTATHREVSITLMNGSNVFSIKIFYRENVCRLRR